MAFKHKQRVHIQSLIGPRFTPDWSELGTIHARKKDIRPLGYWVVDIDGAGTLCIHETQLRAA